MEKIKVGVVGATGYAGAEICRLIAGHPAAELAAISSVSFEGQALSDVYPAYREMCDLICTTQEAVVEKSDVIFAALPHGLSQELAAECDKKGEGVHRPRRGLPLKERGRIHRVVRRHIYG